MSQAQSQVDLLVESADSYNPVPYLYADSSAVVGINDDYKDTLTKLEHLKQPTYFSRIRYAIVSDDGLDGWTIASDNFTSESIPSFPNETAINVKNLAWFKDAKVGNKGVSQVLTSTIEDSPKFFTV